eukprot:TRINITY_DN8117_c0_g1_i1.p2 TRINITY_DN8117_c0_g1~~TRINITY_DN8117_c0_g1_i1.p2  ORF type:complete len:200 (-),score=47.43 TRINITY_DN8117_c0_g1_i1:435-1034(-)
MKEFSIVRKEIIADVTKIKEKVKELHSRESQIKAKLANKKYCMNYILHIQNQQVLQHLAERRSSLKFSKRIKSLPLILEAEPNSPYLKTKLDGLQTTLKKLSIFITYAEKSKERTNKFIETQVYPQKELISKVSGLIASSVKELLIEIKIMKSFQYLNRKFYVQRNPEMFPKEQDKELFLNTSFFDLRLNSLSMYFGQT